MTANRTTGGTASGAASGTSSAGAPPRVAWLNVTLWRGGVGLHRVPRRERQYLVVPPDRRRAMWRVWLAGSTGRAGFVDGHASAELPSPATATTATTATATAGEAAERADVLRLAASEPPAPAGAAGHALDGALDGVFDRYPGCLVALAPTPDGGCLAGARDGTRVVAAPVAGPGERRMTGPQRAGFASFLHAQLVLGLPWAPRGAYHAIAEGGDAAGAAPLWLRVTPLT